MSQILEIALIGVFGLLLLLILIAAIVGVVHAIREFLRYRRRPPIFSLVTWGLALLMFIAFFTTRILWNTKGIDLYLFGLFGEIWEKIELGSFVVFLTAGTGFFVFSSFRTPAEDSDSADSDDDELDEDDREELRRRAAMRASIEKRDLICRLLSIVLPVVLSAIMIGCLTVAHIVSHYVHDATALYSPDGNRVIYVDNSTLVENGSYQGSMPMVNVYEKLNPFMVVRLEKLSGQDAPTELDVSEDNLVWKEDRLRILYGNTYVDYFYYGVTPTED